jgi:hypothetical protein
MIVARTSSLRWSAIAFFVFGALVASMLFATGPGGVWFNREP